MTCYLRGRREKLGFLLDCVMDRISLLICPVGLEMLPVSLKEFDFVVCLEASFAWGDDGLKGRKKVGVERVCWRVRLLSVFR